MFKKTFNMFIAQPMHCCDDDLIRGQRAAITKLITAYFKSDVRFNSVMFEIDLKAIDQFDVADPDDFEKTHITERSKRMYRLGRSIQYLGGADFAVFYGDWMHARGCVVEYIACCQYQIPIVSEKTLIEFCKGHGEFDDEFKLLWPDEFNEFHNRSDITDEINEMTEMIIKSFNFDVPDINKMVWSRDVVGKGINEFLNAEENRQKFKRKIYDAMNLKPEDDINCILNGSRNINKEEKIMIIPEIKNVFFNEVKKTTTVVFNDHTSIIVKCTDNDEFDPEMGLAMALARKCFGSRSKFQKAVAKWIATSAPKNEQLRKKAARKAEREAAKIEHAKAQVESYME